MGAPRRDDAEERRRQEIVEHLGPHRIREESSLDRVAKSVATVCEVEAAHVSLMEGDRQCVVAEVGMDESTVDREHAFCAHTIADNEIFVVEDATDDPRFEDNPYVVDGPEIRFYVGLPLVVDDVPIGTLCALDSQPRELDFRQRSELFGAVSAVEAQLRVRHRYGPESPEHALVRELTATLAATTDARLTDGVPESCEDRILAAERRLRRCVGLLDIEKPSGKDRLGFADTEADER